MLRPLLLTLATAWLCAAPAGAQGLPTLGPPTARHLFDVPIVSVPALDLVAIAKQDQLRESQGLPPRFAIPNPVALTPGDSGLWEMLPGEGLMWRLRVQAPVAGSINLGFSQFELPAGAQLLCYPAGSDGSFGAVGPFTAADNAAHGELWTPVIQTNDLIIELTLPPIGLSGLRLELAQISSGYRGFGTLLKGGPTAQKSGSCNIDVKCPEGLGWEGEIASVGVISTGGSTFCTGYMVNNTANDKKPYFMTANHCGVDAGNAASLVVYWNFETSSCGAAPDGSLADFQTGSFFRASNSASDFTLVELDSQPNPAWNVGYSGWDRSGAEASTAVAIHHPATDEKRISFEFQSTTTTDYLGTSVPGNGTHVRVEDWDIGTTEPGSSGSPLYDQNHRVIGQLHGGYAACGNDDADWYGRFSVSWTGGGTPSSRLSDWLDPLGSGAMTVDTIGAGLVAAPDVPLTHVGPILGPFTNPTVTYNLTNQTTTPIVFQVSLGAGTGLLLNGGSAPLVGSLAPGQSVPVIADLSPATKTFGVGQYTAELIFDDLTNLESSSSIHSFEVGKTLAHDFPLDTDPGWSTTGGWAYGVPLGAGGSYGNPDPTSGATGVNVYGYNLAGDYPDNMTPQFLYSTPIDCSSLSGTLVRFERWLNVETSTYDHAKFWVSNDGVTQNIIWENSGEVTDSAWTTVEYDISTFADGQPSVTLGWTMGTTDGSWTYSGWNVDDVQIEGIGAYTTYGSGCAGSGGLVPMLDGSGDPSSGGLASLDVSQGLPGGTGLIFLSLAPDQWTLDGCDVLLGSLIGTPFVLVLDASGARSLPAPIPVTIPAGTAFFLQYLGLDSGAPNGKWSMSNGMELLVQ